MGAHNLKIWPVGYLFILGNLVFFLYFIKNWLILYIASVCPTINFSVLYTDILRLINLCTFLFSRVSASIKYIMFWGFLVNLRPKKVFKGVKNTLAISVFRKQGDFILVAMQNYLLADVLVKTTTNRFKHTWDKNKYF